VVAVAAAGWTSLLGDRSHPWRRRVAGGLLAAGMASIVSFQVRFHPNQTVYFNALVGGPHGAFARYEMDYWGNCLYQAVAWSAAEARSAHMAYTISGTPPDLVQLNAERFPELQYIPPQRRRHYLHVRLARGDIRSVIDLAAQPALYQVKTRDGVVLCNVVPGPAYNELKELQSRHASAPSRPSR
jgi:hypothetical protein